MELEIDTSVVDALFDELGTDTSVVMINLLRFNEMALYPAGSDLPDLSGREAYFTRYLPAFNRIADAEKKSVVFLGKVAASLVAAEDERWDLAVLVRYADVEAFRDATSCPRYAEEAAPHRRAALADWRLIATAELPHS